MTLLPDACACRRTLLARSRAHLDSLTFIWLRSCRCRSVRFIPAINAVIVSAGEVEVRVS